MAGSTYNQSYHQIVNVNDPNPLLIEGPHISIKLHVRVRDYTRLPPNSPRSSSYFDHKLHHKDYYSIGFSFTPKKGIDSKDLVWGNDFDHPIRDHLPVGCNIAYKIAKTVINPGIDCAAYFETPWSYGPALSCWFVFRIGERQAKGDLLAKMNMGEGDGPKRMPDDFVIEEGADGDGQVIRKQFGIPSDAKRCRRYFLSSSNRENFDLEEARVYHADFYNPYFNPNNAYLKLPGFKIRVMKYVNSETNYLRYVFKDRKKNEVYLVVTLRILSNELESTPCRAG